MLHEITHVVETINASIPNFSNMVGTYFGTILVISALFAAGAVMFAKRQCTGGTP